MFDHTAALDRFRGAFVALVGESVIDAHAVLELVCCDPWASRRFRRVADRTLEEFHAPLDWLDDVAQEMVVLLARDLDAAPALHFDVGRPSERFAGWFYGVMHLLALQALRKLSAQAHPHLELHDDDCGNDPTAAHDLSVDLAAFIEGQPKERRALLEYLLQGFSRAEAGSLVGISPATVTRWLEAVGQDLCRQLDGGDDVHHRRGKRRRPRDPKKMPSRRNGLGP
jgi:DNA-directed RNA polymerase specialized sigma24 family protein